VVILVFLSLKNYISNRSSLSLLLFLILSCYAFSIVFSWFSKLLSVCFQIDYLEIKEIPDPKTAISWILFRISYYRITFVFINLAILFSFEFKKRIFNINHSMIYRGFIYFLAGFNITFSFFIFEKKIPILDVIVFTLALLFECIVYIPFFIESLKNYKITIHPNFKKKFLNLLIMSISFILVLFFLSLDRIFIFFGLGAYTFFYFISWIFVIIGIFTAYRAYFKQFN
jgi:hypothetical protein